MEESTLVFIRHELCKSIECAGCAKSLNNRHSCTLNRQISAITVKDCPGPLKNCRLCVEESMRLFFLEQWETGSNGYSVCDSCGAASDMVLPKECFCDHYRDMQGISCCKTCDVPWNGYSLHFCKNSSDDKDVE